MSEGRKIKTGNFFLRCMRLVLYTILVLLFLSLIFKLSNSLLEGAIILSITTITGYK